MIRKRTGADRYFAAQMRNPEYRATYEAAREAAREAIDAQQAAVTAAADSGSCPADQRLLSRASSNIPRGAEGCSA